MEEGSHVKDSAKQPTIKARDGYRDLPREECTKETPQPKPPDLDQLAIGARSGNRQAFEKLCEHCLLLLRPLARRMVGRQGSEHDVDDIVQTTIWKLVRNIHMWDPARPVKPYIRQIARRTFLDWVDDQLELVPPDTASGLTSVKKLPPKGTFANPTFATYYNSLVFREFFRLLVRCGGYPHEQLAYGYAKVLWAKGLQGDAKSVAETFAKTRLDVLFEKFCEDYYRVSGEVGNSLKELKGHAAPMLVRLDLETRTLFDKPDYLRTHPGLAGKKVAETLLADYSQAAGLPVSIAHWCDHVAESMDRAASLGPRAGRKCNLVRVPPCRRPNGTTVCAPQGVPAEGGQP